MPETRWNEKGGDNSFHHLRHAPGKPQICFVNHSILNRGTTLNIGISDTGEGMSGEVLGHLFEPFFTTKPKGKGTGLGLANVWAYIENFKCAIEVKSEEKKGTTFTLFLPLADTTVKSPTPRQP